MRPFAKAPADQQEEGYTCRMKKGLKCRQKFQIEIGAVGSLLLLLLSFFDANNEKATTTTSTIIINTPH